MECNNSENLVDDKVTYIYTCKMCDYGQALCVTMDKIYV